MAVPFVNDRSDEYLEDYENDKLDLPREIQDSDFTDHYEVPLLDNDPQKPLDSGKPNEQKV